MNDVARRLLPILLLAPVLLGALPPFAVAQDGAQSQVRLALHVTPRPVKDEICNSAPEGGFACDSNGFSSNLVVTGDLLTPYYVYLVALDIALYPYTDEPGLSGIAFGLTYTKSASLGGGLAILRAENCSDLEFPDNNWPHSPPTGNTVTWSSSLNCQNRVDETDPQEDGYAVAYGFYVYAYTDSEMEIVLRPREEPDLKVADCAGDSFDLWYPRMAGKVGFGEGVRGWDPCWVLVPVEETTWGRVKRHFGDPDRR